MQNLNECVGFTTAKGISALVGKQISPVSTLAAVHQMQSSIRLSVKKFPKSTQMWVNHIISGHGLLMFSCDEQKWSIMLSTML